MNSRSFFSIKAHHQGASPSLPSEEMVRLELWPPATNAPPTAGAKDRTRSSSSSPVDGDDTDDDGDDTDDDVDDDEVCLFFFFWSLTRPPPGPSKRKKDPLSYWDQSRVRNAERKGRCGEYLFRRKDEPSTLDVVCRR